MAKDEYIKHLMNNFRPSPLNIKKEMDLEEKTSISGDFEWVLEEIRGLEIKGEKKRLIKIDDKNEEVLRVLYPIFSIDVTRFVNFLLTRFFEEHPEIRKEIKKS